ncbi:MAG: hypothetical protein ABSE80_07625 [Halobacteriota archaeon]|jgi:hypothetical protein
MLEIDTQAAQACVGTSIPPPTPLRQFSHAQHIADTNDNDYRGGPLALGDRGGLLWAAYIATVSTKDRS